MDTRKRNTEAKRKTGSPAQLNLAYLDAALGYRLKRSLVQLYRNIYRALGNSDLTLVQFSVLAIAHDNPGVAQSELAEALGVERPRLVPLIDGLEKRGLAERRPNPKDKRGRMIFLTAEGRVKFNAMKQDFDDHQAKLRDRMGAKEFDLLLSQLMWLERNVDV